MAHRAWRAILGPCLRRDSESNERAESAGRSATGATSKEAGTGSATRAASPSRA